MPANKAVAMIIEITKALEDAGIHCCLVGTSALKYYGAPRILHEWDICVPTDQHVVALGHFRSMTQFREEVNTTLVPDLFSGYPRFVLVVQDVELLDFAFRVIPARAAHLHHQCLPEHFERSSNGIPYPKLSTFVQSVLDVNDTVSLADVIDGMDLSSEWGDENLNLIGTTDAEWATWAKAEIPNIDPSSAMMPLPTGNKSKDEVWRRTVELKLQRGGWKKSKDRYATRFRRIGSIDPRQRERDFV